MGLLKRSSHWKSIRSVIGILYWHYFYIITNIDFFEILVFELNLLLKKFAWIWDFPACLRIHNDNDESADDILQPHHCNRGRAGTQPLARDGVSLRPWEQGWEAWRGQQSAGQWSSRQRVQEETDHSLLRGALQTLWPPGCQWAGRPADRLRVESHRVPDPSLWLPLARP